MKTAAQKKRTLKIDSDAMGRVLDHAHRSRMARDGQRRLSLDVDQVAARAGVHRQTAERFLGLAGKRNTQDPRSSTTMRVMLACGWQCEWRAAGGQR